MQLSEAYSRLCQQMNTIYSQKLWFVMLEQFFMVSKSLTSLVNFEGQNSQIFYQRLDGVESKKRDKK